MNVPNKQVAQLRNNTLQSPTGSNTFDKAVDLTDTVVAIAKEVAEVLQYAPYVKTLTGVILQFIRIRDELKVNKERCQEIINKVLNLSNWILVKLAAIGKSGERVQDNLAQIEDSLNLCASTLKDVSDELEKNQSRSKLVKFISRGLEDLNKLDRIVDNLERQLVRDIVFDIKLRQGIPTNNENADPASFSFASSSSHNHILPPRPYLIVEREDQLDTALQILISVEPSRIAILGGGGFGKTTLARSILHNPKIAERYKYRYFLGCEGISSFDALLLAFGAMLEITTTPSAVLVSARRVLSTSTTLLCLDNFETPWEPSDTRTKIENVLASIADIPNLSLIITMRGTQRPSKVAWSHPLLSPLSPLSSNSAQLILQTICPDHIIDEFTRKLLDVMDGIPLAITLLSKLFQDGETSQSLWQRWSKRQTRVIQTGGDDRESNLNVSVTLSVESHRMKRNPDAKILLAALSLLPSGFPSNVGALLKLEEHLGICDIHSAIETLRTVSLIEASVSGRMQMLSPIRLFCLEFFPSEISNILEKVVEYYITIMLDAGDDRDDYKLYDQVVPEIYNIHSAFQRVYKLGYSQDITRLIDATTHLTNWSHYIGYLSRETIQMALKFSLDLPVQHAECLLSLGHLYNSEGQDASAEKCFRGAAQFFKQGNDTIGEAEALLYLGDVLRFMRQFDQAEVEFKISLELFTQADVELGQANVANSLGNLYIKKYQYSEAEENLMQALEVYKRIHNLIGQANTTESLARLHFWCGDLVTAENFAMKTLTAARQANYELGEGGALSRLGRIYLRTDRLIDAKQVLEQALAIAKRQNSNTNQLTIVSDLAELYIRSDQLSTAEELLTISAKVELDVVEIPRILATLAQVYILGDHLEKAESYLQRAIELFQKFEHKYRQAKVLLLQGTMYLKSGRLDDAERVLRSIPDLGIWQDVEMHRMWILGDFYTVKWQLDKAATSFNSAMVYAKRHQSSYQRGNIIRSMGTLHVKRGRVDRAIRAFKRALEYHRKAQWVSEQAADLKRLGEVYDMLGRSEEGELVFKEAEALMQGIREARVLKL